MPELHVDRLSTALLQAVELRIAPGECVALYGPSGAGKSLLLRAIADLDPNQGEVWLDGEPRSAMPATTWRRRVGYLPTESHWWLERVGAHASDWDRELLTQLGFEPDVLSWSVARLSSGERQRLAIVRLLSHGPAALLLDEPSANLDDHNALTLEAVIRAYRERQRAPTVWVSHAADQRRRIAARQLRIDRGRLAEEAA